VFISTIAALFDVRVDKEIPEGCDEPPVCGSLLAELLLICSLEEEFMVVYLNEVSVQFDVHTIHAPYI